MQEKFDQMTPEQLDAFGWFAVDGFTETPDCLNQSEAQSIVDFLIEDGLILQEQDPGTAEYGSYFVSFFYFVYII